MKIKINSFLSALHRFFQISFLRCHERWGEANLKTQKEGEILKNSKKLFLASKDKEQQQKFTNFMTFQIGQPHFNLKDRCRVWDNLRNIKNSNNNGTGFFFGRSKNTKSKTVDEKYYDNSRKSFTKAFELLQFLFEFLVNQVVNQINFETFKANFWKIKIRQSLLHISNVFQDCSLRQQKRQ